MPQGTRVERCVRKVKKSGRGVNPYAVCQASTKQSYATGKKLESTMKYYLTQSGRELLEARIAEGGTIKGVQRSAVDPAARDKMTDAEVRRAEGVKSTEGEGYKRKPVKPNWDVNRRMRQAAAQQHDREAAAMRPGRPPLPKVSFRKVT
jgi:hypothetical protein